MNQTVLMGITFLIFIICLPTAIALKGKVGDKDKCADIIITGGIGSILAGTLFGIVRPVILQQNIDGAFIYLIIILFFVWYLIVKMFSLMLYRINSNANTVTPNSSKSNLSIIPTATQMTDDNIDSDNGDSSSIYVTWWGLEMECIEFLCDDNPDRKSVLKAKIEELQKNIQNFQQ